MAGGRSLTSFGGLALVALGLLAGCSQPPAPKAAPCLTPSLTPTLAAGTWAGERERAVICLKVAAYDLARAGGPVAAVGPAAMQRCAAARGQALAALRKEGPVYDYQAQRLNEDLEHTADVAAIQARARGCGGVSQSNRGDVD